MSTDKTLRRPKQEKELELRPYNPPFYKVSKDVEKISRGPPTYSHYDIGGPELSRKGKRGGRERS